MAAEEEVVGKEKVIPEYVGSLHPSIGKIFAYSYTYAYSFFYYIMLRLRVVRNCEIESS